MSNAARVALLVQPGEDVSPFSLAIEHGGGEPVVLEASAAGLPPNATGLLIAGTGAFNEAETVPAALLLAIDGKLPVLGIGWGMHALNIALGGQPPAPVEGHGDPARHSDEDPVKHPVVIAPGGKVSYTTAGSGSVRRPW